MFHFVSAFSNPLRLVIDVAYQKLPTRDFPPVTGQWSHLSNTDRLIFPLPGSEFLSLLNDGGEKVDLASKENYTTLLPVPAASMPRRILFVDPRTAARLLGSPAMSTAMPLSNIRARALACFGVVAKERWRLTRPAGPAWPPTSINAACSSVRVAAYSTASLRTDPPASRCDTPVIALQPRHVHHAFLLCMLHAPESRQAPWCPWDLCSCCRSL